MRVAIFVSSILFVVAGAAALPPSAPAKATGVQFHAQDAYGR
ncbi:hypothetical protein [Chenggangzhangella methanolivorans]|nr:hypothetical protein [Chenggangzhangella methanolivorans]